MPNTEVHYHRHQWICQRPSCRQSGVCSEQAWTWSWESVYSELLVEHILTCPRGGGWSLYSEVTYGIMANSYTGARGQRDTTENITSPLRCRAVIMGRFEESRLALFVPKFIVGKIITAHKRRRVSVILFMRRGRESLSRGGRLPDRYPRGQGPPTYRGPQTQTPWTETPPHDKERAVRILLECILVDKHDHLHPV